MAINFDSFTTGTNATIQSDDFVVGFDTAVPGGERKWQISTIANAVSGIMNAQLSNITTKQWSFKTANYTAANNDRIAANTSGGAFTITLPASPTAGTNVTIVDSHGTWDTNNLTIARNGSTIEGLAENLICEVEGDMVLTLLYNGTTWQVYA